MSNLRMLWDNTKFDLATLTVDPPEAEDADWPVENLQDTVRRKAFKSTGTGQLTIKIDLGEGVFANSLALISHNLDPSAVITVRAFSDAWTTETFSEEFTAYEALLWFGDGYFGDDYFGGYPDEDLLELYPEIIRLLFWDDEDPEDVTQRYWAVEIDNGGDAEADEFYIGRMFLCDFFSPGRNFDFGWQEELVDPSSLDTSLGGVKWADVRDRYFRVTFTLPRLLKSEAWGQFLQIVTKVGIRQDMVISLFPDDSDIGIFTAFYGRFTQPPVIQNPRVGTFSAPIEFEESL